MHKYSVVWCYVDIWNYFDEKFRQAQNILSFSTTRSPLMPHRRLSGLTRSMKWHTRVRCAGTGDLLNEPFIYTSKTIPCCIMLSLPVFKRERERELIYVAIGATWAHLNFSSRSGKYSYLTKLKGLSPKGLLYRSGFTWLNKLYIDL